jgi:hypothetical protein
MILFPLLLVAGIIAGFRVRGQSLRSALLIACSALAGLVLFVQAYTGFPLERALPDRSAGSVNLGETIKIQTWYARRNRCAIRKRSAVGCTGSLIESPGEPNAPPLAADSMRR